jgi:hypothetical protein
VSDSSRSRRVLERHCSVDERLTFVWCPSCRDAASQPENAGSSQSPAMS